MRCLFALLKMMAVLDQNALSKALTGFFQRPLLDCPEEKSMYMVEDAFGGNPYWAKSVRTERFRLTLEKGILYRPQIVNEIYAQIAECLEEDVKRGIMVKGPQGIGKSHSLVNTVLKLQSTGEYLVTFIPDCEEWENGRFLLKQICLSFGSTPQDLGIPALLTHCQTVGWGDYPLTFLESTVEEIDAELCLLGKSGFSYLTKSTECLSNR